MELRVTSRTTLTNEQTVEGEVISQSCLSKFSIDLKNRVILEKSRGLIRCRKVLETVRSSRRVSTDGTWSKIEKIISGGMSDLIVDIIGFRLGIFDVLIMQIADWEMRVSEGIRELTNQITRVNQPSVF